VDPWPRRAPGRTPSAKPVQGSAHVPGAVTAPPRGGSVVAPGSPRARSDRLGVLPPGGQRRDELGPADRRAPGRLGPRRADRRAGRRAGRARRGAGRAAARPRAAGGDVDPGRRAPRVHPWARGVDAARFTPRKRCAALRDAVRRLLDPAVRARFGATARRSVLRRTWSTVGDELIAHYAAVLDEFSVKCAVGVATPVPASARPHVA